MDPASSELGEVLEDLPMLERVFRVTSTEAHADIAAMLWDSQSDHDAKVGLENLGYANILGWECTTDDREDSRDQAVEG